jgi:glycosyltransferase involved in cell wall biosynthesis
MARTADKSKKCLSVVIPCFNEERTIFALLSRVLAQQSVGQVIVIDDCSTDKSAEIIKQIKDSRIEYFLNTKNSGKGFSIAQGIKLCKLPFTVIQDADLEYSPEEYPRLLAPLLDGRADAVFGSRFLTYDSRRALYYWHRLGNDFLTTLSNIFTNLDLTDMETCYKFMRTEFAQKLDIQEKRFGLEPEITAKLAKMRARVYEVPISYQGRTYAEGKKITWKDGFRAIYCIIKYNLKIRSKIYEEQ